LGVGYFTVTERDLVLVETPFSVVTTAGNRHVPFLATLTLAVYVKLPRSGWEVDDLFAFHVPPYFQRPPTRR
jgi:hypothetical protein